jgi:hypothetical protein
MKTDETGKIIPENENAGLTKIEKEKLERQKLEKEKQIKDEGVKKGVITASVISFIVLLVAGIIAFSLYSREHKALLRLMEEQKISLTDRVTARDSVISEWIMTFDDIEKNIALIKEKEKVITANSANAEISKDKKLQVLEDIKYINTLLEQNKKKIASLNAQLKKSGGSMKVLEAKIIALEASMKQNEVEINDLKTALVNNTQMTFLQDTIALKNEKISNQTFEMNKAFYVCGTYKDLKAKGLLTKEGGFIGLGKTESLTGNFSENLFVQIDITQINSIPVNSKNAKLITEHPAASYEFLRDGDKKIISLEIKDPALFWKISKYAVVEL